MQEKATLTRDVSSLNFWVGKGCKDSDKVTACRDVTSLNLGGGVRLPCEIFSSVTFLAKVVHQWPFVQ